MKRLTTGRLVLLPLFLGATLLAGAGIASAATPVHGVQQSVPSVVRGQTNVTTTINPSPAGTVNAIDFTAPAGVTITAVAGCPQGVQSTLPASTFHCAGNTNFNGPVTLTLSVGGTATAGVISGTTKLTQTDGTTVTDPLQVNVQDIHSVQQSVPTTAPGTSGTTTFRPSPVGTVNAIDFTAPAGVTITAVAGCPAPTALPASTLRCSNAQGAFNGPVTLTYSVSPSAPFNTTLTGTTTVTQMDGTIVTDAFNVQTPVDPATPMVDPLVGLGVGVLVAGTGAGVMLNRRRRAAAV